MRPLPPHCIGAKSAVHVSLPDSNNKRTCYYFITLYVTSYTKGRPNQRCSGEPISRVFFSIPILSSCSSKHSPLGREALGPHLSVGHYGEGVVHSCLLVTMVGVWDSGSVLRCF